MRAALLLSVLALFMAVVSLGDGNVAKDAVHHNLVASNAYSFY
jgi:hypothetical protein